MYVIIGKSKDRKKPTASFLFQTLFHCDACWREVIYNLPF